MRTLSRGARAPLRERRLVRHPLHVSDHRLDAALGGRSVLEALRGPVRAALPMVAALEADLPLLGSRERADLVARADASLAHRFDLLGSGPVDLGPDIDWHRDFKSGWRWPLHHIHRLSVWAPGEADVLVAWQLSRCHHLPVLAAAARITGEPRYAAEVRRQIEAWIAANPVELGVNWLSSMDVVIRAVNWMAALVMCPGCDEDERWLRPVAASLLLHGRFIRGHLERRTARNNHYLSNVVGMLALSALFGAGPEGRRWRQWAVRELIAEMAFQVRSDGCAHEASIPYHRLVCELLVCGTQAADALCPGTLPGWYRERLGRMLQLVSDYTRPDGLAPSVGDGDDARFLPLLDHGRGDQRRHAHLFAQAGVPPPSPRPCAAYREGGLYVVRAGDLYLLVRCGDTGNDGLGWHAHNDQLSFELALGAQPLVIDPGSYVYGADPAARNRFRSTAFHSTLVVGGAEQNPLRRDNLFLLRDRSRAEALRFECSQDRAGFEGLHRGFPTLNPPAVHARCLRLDAPACRLHIEDTVTSAGEHSLEWTFPLAACRAEADGGRVVARFDTARLEIEGEDVELVVEDGWCSPRYGVRQPVPFVRARRASRPGVDVGRFTLRALPC